MQALTMQASAPPVSAPVAHAFNLRLLVGILGVLLAAITSGINGRVGAIALIDVRGSLGLSVDDGSWLTVIYSAFELAAMPLSAWFAGTFSFRRFHLVVMGVFAGIALMLPAVQSWPWLLALRGLQGFFGGLLIPVLMAAALRFFPLSLRLYGLSLYALTATFSPNLAAWLSALWIDTLHMPSLIYLQVVPLAVLSMIGVAWGIPQDPVRLERFGQINLLGLVTGTVGLVLAAIVLGQGERLDWWHSPFIRTAACVAVPMLAVFLVSEWFHPLPFMRLQLLRRRNLGLGFAIFVCLLIVLLSGSLLPSDYLIERWHFRAQYIDAIGLQLALPQLILGPAVSFLLYKQWVDARKVFALGLAAIAMACFLGSQITSEWMVAEFTFVQALHAIGQPMAVVSMLFLATSVVQPMEGPFVSGIINMLRALGTLIGSTLVTRLLISREHFHNHALVDQLGRSAAPVDEPMAHLAHAIGEQALVLSIADLFRLLGAAALVLIPAVLCLQRMRPPVILKSNS
ncbi:DHA2 family multidrug resistance protein [Luteibacter sp. Sphag1AF]|uniref:MFS transporter n=1 Tax=Luteibacter sp. Sphag1AF TaxID=2587031 RepID=UPI00179F9ACC|nr:MFS transporter [Luteibacter sp. Sphag1AF]MBB3228222.1 DHA2 family multidrug resistance protein [Luteibacter sp. Sphag1AF]